MNQLDVKLTFLNGSIEEEVNVKQPHGFELKGQDKMVVRLRKTLYELN